MVEELTGRRVLVTGAAMGIGAATARACAEAGADVLAVDVDPRVGELPVDSQLVDLSDQAGLDAFAARLAEGPRYDVLVNSAAAYPPGGLFGSDTADWNRVLQVNVVAAATLSRAIAGRLIAERATGSIVNLGSVQERMPLPGYAAYVTTKGALAGLTRALAVELGPYGIRVNSVAPGIVNSPSMVGVLGGSDWETSGQSAPTLLERAGTPDEVADLIVYLASERAAYVTGAEIPVDGGRRLSRRYDPQVDPDADNAVSRGIRETAERLRGEGVTGADR